MKYALIEYTTTGKCSNNCDMGILYRFSNAFEYCPICGGKIVQIAEECMIELPPDDLRVILHPERYLIV